MMKTECSLHIFSRRLFFTSSGNEIAFSVVIIKNHFLFL